MAKSQYDFRVYIFLSSFTRSSDENFNDYHRVVAFFETQNRKRFTIGAHERDPCNETDAAEVVEASVKKPTKKRETLGGEGIGQKKWFTPVGFPFSPVGAHSGSRVRTIQ